MEKSRKLSKALKGRVRIGKGKPHSEESKRKLSELAKIQCKDLGNPNWKGFVITPLGVYETSGIAAQALGLSKACIIKRCNSTKVKWGSWYFDKDYGNGK